MSRMMVRSPRGDGRGQRSFPRASAASSRASRASARTRDEGSFFAAEASARTAAGLPCSPRYSATSARASGSGCSDRSRARLVPLVADPRDRLGADGVAAGRLLRAEGVDHAGLVEKEPRLPLVPTAHEEPRSVVDRLDPGERPDRAGHRGLRPRRRHHVEARQGGARVVARRVPAGPDRDRVHAHDLEERDRQRRVEREGHRAALLGEIAPGDDQGRRAAEEDRDAHGATAGDGDGRRKRKVANPRGRPTSGRRSRRAGSGRPVGFLQSPTGRRRDPPSFRS